MRAAFGPMQSATHQVNYGATAKRMNERAEVAPATEVQGLVCRYRIV